VRISASDHKNIDVFAKDDQGWDIFQSIEFAKELKKLQVDVIDCSTGGNLTDIQVNKSFPCNKHKHELNLLFLFVVCVGRQYPAGPLWQVPFAEAIKQKVGIRTSAVGIITKGKEAEDILQENKADFVSVAREFLRDSAFVLTAARDLGVNVTWPKQYFMANRAGSIFKGKK
jgi:2,4-dienoyl-CoA reductase-like NADH-dependent reductase (Old Yellow Enzyme family)